jgi:hypothetical protein
MSIGAFVEILPDIVFQEKLLLIPDKELISQVFEVNHEELTKVLHSFRYLLQSTKLFQDIVL